jgi:uracil-DNA glycosylase family protein
MNKTATLSAAELASGHRSFDELREAAAGCQACDLWKLGTQTVFGEGTSTAELMLVGEQPGDKEDLAGRPFVGPAGRLLDEALEEAGIDRRLVYVTNVVKHFKWKARGKRRIHDKPSWSEIAACRPWLEAELAAVEPNVLVLLGASAAQSLLGRSFRVTRSRGEILEGTGIAPYVMATIHPSAVLRAPDAETREREQRELAKDLAGVAPLLSGS